MESVRILLSGVIDYAGLFPPAGLGMEQAVRNLARFLSACTAAGVPFKATAGLHHAVRGVYRLTSEANSAAHVMHGFLNLLLAAALAWKGADGKLVAAVLDERSCDAFRFDEGGVVWRTARLENHLLAEARRSLVIAFGSCSFEEPLSELKHLGLL